jgi:hypothetical protein
MLEAHVARVLEMLTDDQLVLDVGGWACPFNRANWVLDSEPYETRGFYREFGGQPSQAGAREWFTRQTWVQRDICGREPWPFSDKQFDFAICSHTLEDVRDPIGVCAELARVSRAGYIEVPSREYETCLGLERPGQAGLSHHRWLVEIHGTHLRFVQKYHMIHHDRRFVLPNRHRFGLTPERSVSCLFWEGSFTCDEVHLHGIASQERELEQFVNGVRPPWSVALALDRVQRSARRLADRGIRFLYGRPLR